VHPGLLVDKCPSAKFAEASGGKVFESGVSVMEFTTLLVRVYTFLFAHRRMTLMI
jgi:hypothetical protein